MSLLTNTTPPAHYSPRVSIIMLSYNAPNWTKRCLQSILRWTPVSYELIIVDNGSRQETLELLDQYDEVPGVRLIKNSDNRGYAAANNQGLVEANGELVVFLNNDVIVTQGWLNNITEALDTRPDVAAAGPRTNHASGVQGGIFLSSLESKEIDRFAAHFNWSDPTRWQETDSLSGFVLAVRQSVLDEVGAFDERFGLGTAEDRELCTRIRSRGYGLLSLGDTFVFHAGHASFLENRLNFAHQNNLNRILLSGEDEISTYSTNMRETAGDAPEDKTVITIETGAKYVFRAGVLHPVASHHAIQLLGFIPEKGLRKPQILQDYPIGDPVFFIRSFGASIYLFAFGQRKVVQGNPDRIARLRGITVLPPDDLAKIPETGSVRLEDSGSFDPYGITGRSPLDSFESRLMCTDAVVERVEHALDSDQGLSIIRLGSGEAIVLNNGIYDVHAFNTDYSGITEVDDKTRAMIVRSIQAADIVGITTERRIDYCAPLLEKVFAHFNIAPRYTTSAFVNWELIGVDRDTGTSSSHRPPLKSITETRRLAIVGRLARAAYERQDDLEWNVTVTAEVEGVGDVDSAFATLAESREDFDLALVSAGIPAVVLCPMIAQTLGRVAIDFGHSLNHLLNPLFDETTLIREKLKWRLQRYIEQQSETHTRSSSELDGIFCRSTDGAVYYIEQGRRRFISSRDLIDALGHKVIDVLDTELEKLELGLPFFVAADDLAGAFIIKDGEKVPVVMGVPWVGAAAGSLANLPTSSMTIQMTPTASKKSSEVSEPRLIRAEGSPAVYLEQGNHRRHITSKEAVERLERVLGPVIAIAGAASQ